MQFIYDYLERRHLKTIKPFSDYTKVITSDAMGRGVVLTQAVKAGTLLGIYPGKHLNLKEFLEKEEFVTKSVKSAYFHGKDEIIDPTDIFGFVPNQPQFRIALINEPPENSAVNTIAISSNRHVWYVAISDISAGEQLYTNYGESYERNYRSSKLNLSSEQLSCLAIVADKYIWLRAGLKLILED